VENLKKEKRDESKMWQKKMDEKDRIIVELRRQLGRSEAATLPRIDTRVSGSAGSSPVSAGGAASYLRSFNPFGRT
jgi:hypothetical protein